MTQNSRRMREPHLDPYFRLLDATEELQKKAQIKPVPLAEVEEIAKAHQLETHDLLSHASIESKIVIDYRKGEVRWVSR